MAGGSTISTSDTKLEALSLQSSSYGVTIPVLYGVNRIAGNLVWYGGFKAIAHTTTQSQGGKGGGTKTQNTTYTYTAALMLGLCEGQITGIPRIWKGKQLYSGGASAGNIATIGESYAIPVGGGTYTVGHAAAFAANIGVSAPGNGSGDPGDNGWTLAEGVHYTRVGGVYTFVPGAADGVTVTVAYQWTYGSIPQTAMAQLGLSMSIGVLGQATWSYLTTNFPSQAIGYSGLAMVYAQDYALGTSAQVDNHTFEVQGPQAYSISAAIPDADPAKVTWDVLINGRYGAAFPSPLLGNVTPWSTYCLASGLLMSPAIDTQMQAAEVVASMGKLTNTAPVWSGGKLKMIPYGDTALSANGATYTPNITPLYDLTDDDFLGGGDPIKVTRLPQADAWNHIRVEFLNRANLYNIEIAEVKDSANIDAFGLRSASILQAHWICDAAIAANVAQLLLQRTLYVRNTYEFQLPWTKVLIEPMVLLTLTDAGLGFAKLPVRVTQITEDADDTLTVTAEDFPLGVANASLYPSQSGAGFQHNYSVAPGSIAAPMIFEAPGALAQNGLEIYVAATGTGASWGGCNVWVSLDGANYRNIGTLNGGSRYGTLTSACGASGTISVALNAGVLASGSVADAAALNTLAYIGGASNEYFSFNTATLTSALHYDLAGSSVRGAYVTPAAAHASGDKFVRVDSAIARSGPVDLVYVGKTIHVKCTSFNIYGAAEESLAAVTDYTYTVSGAQVQNNAGAAALTGITSAASDNILSASEKPPIIQDYTVITSEQSGLDAQATSYSVTTEKTAYDAAITALTAYLATLTAPTLWSNVAGDTTIVGTTFRSKFADVYTAKQTLANRIAAVAGTVANYSGLAGTPGTAIANSNITVNSSGQIVGIGTGGVVVDNTKITVNSDGSLAGGGTGAPTLSGIAGTLVAGQIGAGLITTNKLLVTGQGAALNDDPYTLDITAWSGGYLASDSTCPCGTSVIESVGYTWLYSRRVPLDPARNYQYRFWIKNQAGVSSLCFGMVMFYDASGAVVYTSTGWPGAGAFNYFGLVGGNPSTSWTEYQANFGPGESYSIPAGAKTMAIGVLCNYSGSAGGATVRLAGMRVFEKSSSDMIVDGSIIAQKIGALAVSASKIAAGSLAVGQSIYSNGYVPGVSGWSINASGSAEFGSVAIRDVLTLQNSQISISSGGTLSGAGGGTVSIGGLGYSGDLNATNDLALYQMQGGGQIVAGNNIGGTAYGGSWYSVTGSLNAYTGGCFCSYRHVAGVYYIAGLTTSPSTSITGIAYAFIIRGNDVLTAREFGSYEYALATLAAGDVVEIDYDGSNIRYLRNGSVLRTVTASAGQTFYFAVSCITVASIVLQGVKFGPMSSNAWVSISGQPAGIYNSSISISGGTINGIGTGAGTVVDNSLVTPISIGAIQTSLGNAPGSILNGNVSIGSNGVLSGAGGGTVTIGGLGYSGSLSANNTYLDTTGRIQGVSAGGGVNAQNDFSENNATHVLRPHGGGWGSGPVSGSLAVTLPNGWANTMLRFEISVYEYASSKSVTYQVGGYTYAGSSSWYNTFATAQGDPSAVRPVYFGVDGFGRPTVWIGVGGADTWQYPIVQVLNFVCGYSNYSVSQWDTNWVTQFVSAPGTVHSSFAAPTSGGASSVPWTGVVGRPTNVSSFTNDSGYITSSGTSAACSGLAASASAVAWSGVSSKPTTIAGYGITDFSLQSIATNGYQKLPGGLIIQWGAFTGTAVTFPIAFPTGCLSISGTSSNASTTGAANTIAALSASGATYYTLGNAGGRFIAIGY